jgi:hypothetical protein
MEQLAQSEKTKKPKKMQQDTIKRPNLKITGIQDKVEVQAKGIDNIL